MVIKIKFRDDKNTKHYNSFDEVQQLENYNDITYLDCSENSLDILPDLPHSLTYLDCSGNDLYNLPKLPHILKNLNCSVNMLSSLAELPEKLEELCCHNNR